MRDFFNNKPKHPQMDNYSYSDIIQHLKSRYGGLKAFLMQIPSQKLEQVIQLKQIKEDQRIKAEREANMNPDYRQNVASFTVSELTHRCINQGIKLFGQLNQYGVLSMRKHPRFGMKLVDLKPQKYYVGPSKHTTHSKQLDKLYFQWDPQNAYEYSLEQNIEEQGQENSNNMEFSDNEDLDEDDFIIGSSEEEEQEKEYISEKKQFQILKQQVPNKKQSKKVKKQAKLKKIQETSEKIQNIDFEENNIESKYLV